MCGGDGAHHCEVGVTMTPLVIGFFFFFSWRITALQCCVGSAIPD